MRIQYCSDLHLEFPENKDFLKLNPLKPNGDILLLAGDIVPFAIMHKHSEFFDFVGDHFETTYWVPGNHEYYQSDLTNRTGRLHEKIRDNVFLVNNLAIMHSEIKLIFSTLWANISPANQWYIQHNMSDFQVIHQNDHLFSPSHFNKLNEESLQFLQKEINQEKSIVVTHHIPTFLHYPKEYKGDPLNEAFAIELHDFIESSGIQFWLFGHHHRNLADFNIGATRMITNQLGYVNYGEQGRFDVGKTIEV